MRLNQLVSGHEYAVRSGKYVVQTTFTSIQDGKFKGTCYHPGLKKNVELVVRPSQVLSTWDTYNNKREVFKETEKQKLLPLIEQFEKHGIAASPIVRHIVLDVENAQKLLALLKPKEKPKRKNNVSSNPRSANRPRKSG